MMDVYKKSMWVIVRLSQHIALKLLRLSIYMRLLKISNVVISYLSTNYYMMDGSMIIVWLMVQNTQYLNYGWHYCVYQYQKCYRYKDGMLTIAYLNIILMKSLLVIWKMLMHIMVQSGDTPLVFLFFPHIKWMHCFQHRRTIEPLTQRWTDKLILHTTINIRTHRTLYLKTFLKKKLHKHPKKLL